MTKSESPKPAPHGPALFAICRQRRILFIALLAIVLAFACVIGIPERTVSAQKGTAPQAEAALESKADFLLRRTYRVARSLKKQDVSTTDAQSALQSKN